MKNVAVIYHFFALYREPIVRTLSSNSDNGLRYRMYSDFSSESDIAVIDPGLSKVDRDEGGLPWRRLKNLWFRNVFLWQKGLLRLSLNRDYTCLIFLGNMYFLSTWVAAIFGRMTGKRVLFWTHGFIREDEGMKGRLRTLFYRLAHGLLLYGNRSREIAIRKGFSQENLYVIYNSLDYSKQKKIRESIACDSPQNTKKKLFANPDLPLLMFVGRLTPQKRLDLILAAAKELERSGCEVNVLFVGDGRERQALTLLVDELNMNERVYFYGSCHDEQQLAPLIMAADLCVAPGEVGLTAMHALAYGTPVITHNDFSNQMPEYEAIVEGASGTFFTRGDKDDLAQKIRNWLDNAPAREVVARQCTQVIENRYNPDFQRKMINRAVLGMSPP